jgi:peptidoglycan/LPS O-acetylase OafA/YrhL
MASTVAEQQPSGAQQAPDALRPPPGNPRFPLLDSVRGVAALAVLITHVGGISGFNYKTGGEFTTRLTSGVTLFFVLSGFLIYRPFVAARLDARAAPRPTTYLRRRALRIIPAYWLALTILTVWPGLGGHVFHHPFRYYLFLQTLVPGTVFGGMTQVWSLCVEVAFYIALPVYAFAAGRWLRGRDRSLQVRVELIVLALLAVGSVVLRWRVHVHNPSSTTELMLPAFLYWFGLGMGLAVISAALAHRDPGDQPRFVGLIARRPWLPWIVAAISFWAVSTRFGVPYRRGQNYDETALFAEHVLYGLTAFMFVLPAVFADRAGGWPRRLLANRVLAWLGLISYGIFLWNLAVGTEIWHHTFIGHMANATIPLFIATLAVTIAIASASYYFVERPLLRFKG